ncbi:MAG TPA: polyprenyl synthetase family protein [Acidimicrobiales bacterium]|nr:polyprenyl synthetase family protein [Acidimicrobiales bacterium]
MPPAFLPDLVRRVDARITDILETEADRWAAVDPDWESPLGALRRLVLAGGKRLRPAFCFWAFVGLGGEPDDHRIIDAGAALELLHSCAVIHDDVIDGSERRHGVDALHVEFARRHELAGWRGEGQRFGEGVAILVGDLAFVYADMLLGDASREAHELFNQLRLEVNLGQYLDLLGTVRRNVSPEAAGRICEYKSAKYTVERPLHLGAALAAPDRLAELMRPFTEYGLPLGEAFQLKDDILGVFGDPTLTGKPVGEDLREGKPTLLFAIAREVAVGAGAALLTERFGAPDLTADEVVEIQAVFEETGARAQVEATIEQLVESSQRAATALPVTEQARHALIQLAEFVAGRQY